MMALTGVVKWFDPVKGWGFIDVLGIDYFVHYRSIQMSGFKTLSEGQIVTFIASKGEKGWSATELIIVKEGVDLDPS